MRVQVAALCAPHPVSDIEAALRSAGKTLAVHPDSVTVEAGMGVLRDNRREDIFETMSEQSLGNYP